MARAVRGVGGSGGAEVPGAEVGVLVTLEDPTEPILCAFGTTTLQAP